MLDYSTLVIMGYFLVVWIVTKRIMMTHAH